LRDLKVRKHVELYVHLFRQANRLRTSTIVGSARPAASATGKHPYAIRISTKECVDREGGQLSPGSQNAFAVHAANAGSTASGR
jgi:hypothetical protein